MIELLADYKKLLAQFVQFRTVSTNNAFKEEIERCVVWLGKLFREQGFRVEVWRSEKGNPVIFAYFRFQSSDDRNRETILIYGHYDVQPADFHDGWKSDPYTLKEKNGKYFGRGVLDNKGQILIHILTVFQLIRQGRLGCEVKFVIEGNEESEGSPLESMIFDPVFQRKITADYVLISDGEIEEGRPALEVSLRGGFNCTLHIQTAETDLHSGQHGGATLNAADELVKILAKLEFPEFRTDVDTITKNQKVLLTDAQIKTGLLPTIQISGIKSGYTDQGYKNIIPAWAEARLNFRLVCSQKPEDVFTAFKKYVLGLVPEGAEVTITAHGFHDPVKLETDFSKAVEVKRILTEVYGQKAVHKPVGGAVPIVSGFQKYIQKRILMVPLGNSDGNMHGTQENFRLDLISKGLDFSRILFSS